MNLEPKEKEVLDNLSDFCIPSVFEIHNGFSRLSILDLRNSSVTDEHLKDIENLEHLKQLLLGNTQIGDKGLKHLRKLKRLEILGLVNTRITDDGLRYLKGLSNLKKLRLGNTAVTDKGVKQLKHLDNLEVIGLIATSVSENAVDKLKKQLPNTKVRVSNVPIYSSKEIVGENRDPTAFLNNSIEIASSTKGLPIAIDTWELGAFEPAEITTLAVLASPLTIWRGWYIYEMKTFKPAIMEGWPGDFKMPLDVVVAANTLIKHGLIVHVPKPSNLKVRDKIPPEVLHNFEKMRNSLEKIEHVRAIKVRPAAEMPQDLVTIPLKLPVIFPSSPFALEYFLDTRKDELTKLQRGLRSIFQESQNRNKKDIPEILESLTLEIRELDKLYSSTKEDVYRGVKVKCGTGLIGITLALLIPELRTPSSTIALTQAINALQSIYSMRPNKDIKKSDFYLAWEFRSNN